MQLCGARVLARPLVSDSLTVRAEEWSEVRFGSGK